MSIFSLVRAVAEIEDYDSNEWHSTLADLQDALGQDDGGLAAIIFSEHNEQTWKLMGRESRVHFLSGYVRDEIIHMVDWSSDND